MKDLAKVIIRGKIVDIDAGCVPMVDFFNKIGFYTRFCCQGHEGESVEFNIMFEDIIENEDIVKFLKHFRNKYKHTNLWGDFKLWCREMNGVPYFNWIYEAPNLRCANEDFERFQKADLSKDFVERDGIKVLSKEEKKEVAMKEVFGETYKERTEEEILVYRLSQAITLVAEKHEGQVDKGGNPYILHPLAVMNNVNTIEEKIVAVLHDILEDTDVTENELGEDYYDFNDRIVDAVVCLTRLGDETYMNYIKRVSTNKLATTVKIADLEHNMDLSRLNYKPTKDDLRRVKKYKKAYDYLLNNNN